MMMFNNVNQGGKNMKGGDRELEMLLNEIPQVTYLSHLHQNHHHHLPMSSPSHISSSSNFSNGFGSSEDGSSPSLTTFDEFCLSETLNRIHIRDDDSYKDFSNRLNPNGFQFRDNGISRCNVDNYYPNQGFNGDVQDYTRFQSPISEFSARLNEYNNVGNHSMESYLTRSQIPSLYSDPKINYLMKLAKEQERVSCNGGIQFPSSSFNDGFRGSQHGSIDSTADPTTSFKSLHSSLLDLCLENQTYNPSLLKQSRGITGDFEAFNCEDSLIIQGKSLKYVVEKGCEESKTRKTRSEISVQPTYGSLAEVQGSIYFLAKDQQGCRFLQKMFEEGVLQDVQIIFNEIIDHIVELMMDPFGNYLVQKLMDVSTEEQRTLIVIMVTREPGELVKICLNSHGTRVVQKLISTLKMKQQISLIIMALEPGFLDLVKDVHGNHVVQRCLQCLSKEHIKFIFNAAAKFCVNIATHRHGCCVLNRCIAHSTGKHRDQILAEVAANALLLSQDAFGNYVVQYIIELKIPSATMALLSQFEGNYVQMSMQKFSSHVVEKCLRCCEESRSRIVPELLSVRHFDHLLQHPFSNYVVQSALEVTKGRLHAALVEAVQPHMILRSSPYCKKLFSRNLLKK